MKCHPYTLDFTTFIPPFSARFLESLWERQPRNDSNGFHLMEQTLIPIRYLFSFFFFIYTSLYHYCFTMSCKQDTAVDGRVCIYVGVSVFPLILCRVPASTRHTSQFRFNVCTDLPSLCSTSCCLHQLDLMLVWDVTNSCLTIT